MLAYSGLESVIKYIDLYANPDGIYLLCRYLSDAIKYDVVLISTESDILDAIDSAMIHSFSKSEVERFRLLHLAVQNNDALDTTGRFFKIVLNGDIHGVVFVHRNGSFASTSGMFGHYGIPDELCFAVFRRGHVHFNFKAHCHSHYWLSHTKHVDTPSIVAVAGVADATIPNLDCSWNFAITKTAQSWNTYNGVSSTREAIIESAAKRQLSKSQQIQKLLNEIREFITHDNSALTAVTATVIQLREN